MQTIVQLLRESCERYPHKVAVREKIQGSWQEISYGELWDTTARLAAGLLESGFRPGEQAALLAPSSSAWLMAYLGVLKAGGVVVPVDKELKSIELRHILGDCDARLVFTEEAYLPTLREIVAELPDPPRLVLLRQSREGGRAARRGGGSAEGERVLTLRDLERDPVGELPAGSPAHTAVILYTSGTTGRSKGAMLSHGNIVSNINGAVAHLQLDHTIHTLSLLPISHIFEQVCGVLLPLSLGGTVSFCESVKKLSENLAEVRPTFFLGVPALYRKMLDRILKNINGRLLSRLLFQLPPTRPLVSAAVRRRFGGTTFISGGAALDSAISRDFAKLGLTIYQGYGVTETSPVIAAECARWKRPGTVGHTLPEVEVRIEAPNEEQVGEIVVKGPNVMQGYYKNPGASAEVLHNGWYRTGDLGCLEDGYLRICGRAKNLIVTENGKNVYPEEVEIELSKSPFIAEVVVHGQRTPQSTEEIHAIIYPDQEALEEHCHSLQRGALTPDELATLLQREVSAACATLAGYKRVKRFTVRTEEFPKTTTRKIKRFEL